MNFLLGGCDIKGDRFFCVRNVDSCFIAPGNRVKELLGMALKTLHCSLDCAASGFGSVARPYVHTIENCRLMLLPSRQRLSDCRQRPTEVRSTVRVNGLV